MPTATERLLTQINASTFFKEFTFDKNRFHPRPGNQEEFADGALWLKDHLIVFQVKERATGASSEEEPVRRWFNEKVKRQATRQIRDTLSYLEGNPTIVLTNSRGHSFNVNTDEFESIVSVVLYQSECPIPEDCAAQRYHISRSTGDEIFIHILTIEDYSLICDVLITPIEVVEYLRFRERYLHQFDATHRSEISMLGRFLMSPEVPEQSLDGQDRDYSDAVKNLKDDSDELEVRRFLERMGEKWERGEEIDETKYYRVLIAFALLCRTGLRCLGERMKLAIRNAVKDVPALPYSFEIPERNIGYVVVPLIRELYEKRQGYLARLVELKMYERKLDKCAGVSVVFSDDRVDIDWCYGERPWSRNPELERFLKENGSPFWPVRGRQILRYDTKT